MDVIACMWQKGERTLACRSGSNDCGNLQNQKRKVFMGGDPPARTKVIQAGSQAESDVKQV